MLVVDCAPAASKLRHNMPCRRFLVTLGACVVAAVGCERRAIPRLPESAVAANPVAGDSTTASRLTLWNHEAGPALLVSSEAPNQAIVVPPDTAADTAAFAGIPRPASATLIGRNGTVQVADVQPPTSGDPCDPWTVTSAPPPRPWTVGFVGGVVTPVAMDSIEAAAPADSAKLAAAVVRLASVLPNDKAGRFSGLPFQVRAVYRFTLPNGRQVVVATLIRQINQEASPLAERTLLIAERNTTGADTSYTRAYYEQSRGPEETVESTDALAALLVGSARRPTLVVTRDFGEETAFGFIERVEDGRWAARWSSTRRRC